jgi:hypothetical protein
MIDHLKSLTDGIVNRTVTGGDLFLAHPQIYRELQSLSPDQFAEPHRVEFTLVHGVFARLSNPNPHEVITGEKVIAAAKRLRPLLKHYLGSKPTAPLGAPHFTFNTIEGDNHVGDKINIGGNVASSAVGSNASLKARNIITQVQQSGLDADLKQKFAEAAATLVNLNISEGAKEDAADDLAKLKNEMEKPAKDEGRIKTIWDRINSAASILASGATIGKIVTGTP